MAYLFSPASQESSTRKPRVCFLSVASQGRAIDHIGWRSTATINDTKAMLESKQVQLTSQPSPLTLPNGPPINFFYVAGPNGARIEIVERPGLQPGQ
jgi:hypothetical protein